MGRRQPVDPALRRQQFRAPRDRPSEVGFAPGQTGPALSSSNLAQLFFEASAVPCFILDLEGRLRFANERAADCLGCSSAELLGRCASELAHPEDVQGLLRSLAASAAAPSQVISHEFRYLRSDGGTVWVRGLARALPASSAEPLVLLRCTDISDLKRTQAALQESEARYRTLLDHMSEGLIQVDNNDVIQYVNDRFCEQVGYTREELLGQPAIRLLGATPQDQSAVLEKNRLRLEGVSDRYTVQIRKKSGEIIWFMISGAPVIDAGGRVVGSVGIHTDVTAERRAGEEQARLAAVLEATTDCVFTTDRAGHVLFLNRSGRRMLAVDEGAEVAHLTFAGLLSLAQRGIETQDIQAAAERGGVWTGDAALLARDGRRIPVSLVTLAHRSSEGTVEVFSHIARDISERKAFEEQMVYLASHDPLTGLYNRRRFQEALQEQLAQTRRYGARWALLYLDLDHFKAANDRLGHEGGDQLLVVMAQTLRRELRETDVLARLGGDEFACLLPNTDGPQAGRVAERVRTALKDLRVVIEGHAVAITTSVGIALCPEHGASAQELLTRADLAMYHAKEQGRDSISFYTRRLGSPQ
ncbi:MAG: PAS domain S-box protein [Chloroflexi bacterium]|nr:PAS domain S-box protein [Chloroflexota bacterium]